MVVNGKGNGGHCVVKVVIKIFVTANIVSSSADAGLRSRAQVPTINVGCVKLREYLFLKFGLVTTCTVQCSVLMLYGYMLSF